MRAVTARDRCIDALIARAAPSPGDEGSAIQRAWLESLMLQGARCPRPILRAACAHPLRLAAAASLLWAERDDDAIAVLLRMTANGNLVRLNGKLPTSPRAPSASRTPPSWRTTSHCRAARVRARPADDPPARTAPSSRCPLPRRALPSSRGSPAAASASIRSRPPSAVAAGTSTPATPRTLTARAAGPAPASSRQTSPRDSVRGLATPRRHPRRDRERHASRPYGCSERHFEKLHVITISELLWISRPAHGRPADARPQVTPPARSNAPTSR